MTTNEEKRPTPAVNNDLEREDNNGNENDTISSKTQYTRRLWGIRLPPYFDTDFESTVKRKLDVVLL
jgi:MFS transporter, ACS family, pantothenate transporter